MGTKKPTFAVGFFHLAVTLGKWSRSWLHQGLRVHGGFHAWVV
jgi:hypothetical protein